MTNDVPKLHLKRIAYAEPAVMFTIGKLYKVVAELSYGYRVTDDEGKYWGATYGDVRHSKLWQLVWILPDGTELEALE